MSHSGTSPPSHVHAGTEGIHMPLIGQDLGGGSLTAWWLKFHPPLSGPQTVPFSVLASGKTDEGLSGTVTVRVNRACQYSPVTAKASSSPSPLQRHGQLWTISGNCSSAYRLEKRETEGAAMLTQAPALGLDRSRWACHLARPPVPPWECGNGNRGLHKNLSMNVHSSIFIPAKKWKQSKCHLTKEWINQMRYIHIMTRY